MSAQPSDERAVEAALLREASSVAQHLGIGATAIGKADFGRTASYAEAFFALSVGLERGAKLALTLDAAASTGAFLRSRELRDFGHDLERLMQQVSRVAQARGIDAAVPDSDIHRGIRKVLTAFASNVNRYYNLEVLAMSQPGSSDPIVAWYRDVRVPVVAAHYSSVRRDAFGHRLERIAVPANMLVSIIASSETGEEIRTLSDLMQRQEEARVAHPWERMYVLQLARFVTHVIGELGGRARGRGLPVPYLDEFFYGFQLEDREFRRRKVWTIEP